MPNIAEDQDASRGKSYPWSRKLSDEEISELVKLMKPTEEELKATHD